MLRLAKMNNIDLNTIDGYIEMPIMNESLLPNAYFWHGYGAITLPPLCNIEISRLIEILQGKFDDGRKYNNTKHVDDDCDVGYTLTFSVPRSLSIVGVLNAEKSFYVAHESAVTKALNYLENEILLPIKDDDANIYTRDNLQCIFACFAHDTEVDKNKNAEKVINPHLHTQIILPNRVLAMHGSWYRLSQSNIHTIIPTVNMVYQSTLAKAVVDNGYEIRRGKKEGAFELEGISNKQITQFYKNPLPLSSVTKQQ